jgi:lipopolysaccharide transport system ATP-binding protein
VEAGRVRQQGAPAEVVSDYCQHLSATAHAPAVDLEAHAGRHRGSRFLIKHASMSDAQGLPTTSVPLGGTIAIQLELGDFIGGPDTTITIQLCDAFGTSIAQMHSKIQSTIDLSGLHSARARCTINDIRLLPGEYRVDVGLGDSSDHLDRVEDALRLTVDPADIYGTGRVPRRRNGLVAMSARWHVVPTQPDN